MKRIGTCPECGGKIIKIGNGNVYCEDCYDNPNKVDMLDVLAKQAEKRRELRKTLDAREQNK